MQVEILCDCGLNICVEGDGHCCDCENDRVDGIGGCSEHLNENKRKQEEITYVYLDFVTTTEKPHKKSKVEDVKQGIAGEQKKIYKSKIQKKKYKKKKKKTG